MNTEEIKNDMAAIKANVEKVIVGKGEVIDLLMTAMLAGGHVLLEDVPGTGKTMLARALARSMKMDFSRIQFTPDLLPSDVTGIHYYNQKEQEFILRTGPVFTDILLADEINRATPRTQSSLLESMEEHQVTIDGESLSLGEFFFVVATENPIESTGTFPLPEAQLDRFMMRVAMGYPDKEQENEILNRNQSISPVETLQPVCDGTRIMKLRAQCEEIFVHPLVQGYLLDIVRATRKNSEVECGASPRASISLLKAARCYAAIQGSSFVTPEMVRYLAPYLLGHRLVMKNVFGQNQARGQELVETIAKRIIVPTENFSR